MHVPEPLAYGLGVERHRIDGLVYAGYRAIMLSGHRRDNGLGNMSSEGNKVVVHETHLDQEENGNVSRMEAHECDGYILMECQRVGEHGNKHLFSTGNGSIPLP